MYSPNSKAISINDFIGGLNVTKSSTEINDNQTPDAQNWMNNELQGINSRYGYSRYYSTAIGLLNVNNLFTYNTYSTSQFILAYGTSLLLDLTTSTQLLHSGIVSGKVRAFEIEGNIYFLDGSGYIQYNGSAATSVSGYIPTHYINKSPDGTSGSKLEELNYIQSSFTETFNGNGTATTFYMTYGSLTTGSNIVIVDNVTLTSGAATAGFNVNYASGYFTLTTAATTGIGNVEITTAKPVLSSTSITNCTFAETYGEGNATFVFMSGNSSFPARIFWSDTLDPTYFPATSYADVGVTNDKMMGFLSHNGALQLWKYRSVHSFNGTPPNNSITEIYKNNEGCIATDSLRVINGLPTCLSQRGVIQLVPETDRYNFNVISEDVNGRQNIRSGILTETLSDRQNAISYDFDNKYWLNINGKIYILQYDIIHNYQGKAVHPWLRWELATQPTCFADKENYLYFGGTGNFYKFDPGVLNDDGTAIDSYFYSKKYEVEGSHDWIKWFLYMYFNYRLVFGNTTVTTTIYIDDVETGTNSAETILSYWNPNLFDPNDFNPNSSYSNVEKRISLHKKGKYIQFKIQCNTLNNSFALVATKLDYLMDRKVR